MMEGRRLADRFLILKTIGAMMEGRRLADRFLILKTIGAGGATEVSLAQDAEMGELVALRVLTAPFVGQWETLRDACRDARRLAHPHIARVFDFYRSEGTPFICREYVEGASIGDFAGRSIDEAFVVFAEVAAALESAHGLGVVHGDLKASKILRDVRGNVRVIDFRIAAALRAGTPPMATGDQMSPQVRMGETPVEADDIYALGVLIAQTITLASAPRELGELIGAMSAEQRNARLTNLSEIREALTAFSNSSAGPPEASSSAAPVLRPPAAAAVQREASPARRESAESSRNLQYAIAAGVLALAALVVFVVLPHWVKSSGTPESPSESAEMGDEETSSSLRETATASKSSVESMLAQLIPMREQLETAGVERWAATDHARAKEIEGRGDAAFIKGDYATAKTHYGEALVIVEELAGQRGAALAASLEAGADALEEGDQQRAIESFGLALAIEPNDAAALEGARRAEGLGALMSHMSAGKTFEAGDALDSARGEYAKALEIDPQYAPAREALERVETVQADHDYESNLSLALVSMANGNLGAARSHFERARALRPDSPEVVGGLRQLQQIESSRAIASLRKRAEAAESTEDWSEAASLYQTILKTQDNLSFAEKGLQRNRELARIAERIAKLLSDPTQLFRPEELEEAGNLVEFGQRAADGKPKLGQQVRNLEIAVQLASTPIAVVFESDSVTEVVIRGVGTLGNFARRDVPLKPGRYVVLGRRDGYRDTRSEISVIPGRQQPVVEVRCTEKI
jgi:serine/threonine protein kinase/Tfp pilus assembly protein PilF